MSDLQQSNRSGMRTCGACRALVQPHDVTCHSCGVLLAAYQAPSGSLSSGDPAQSSATLEATGAASATRQLSSPSIAVSPEGDSTSDSPILSTPTSTAPAFEPSPLHRPKSQSPIGDALQRSGSRPDFRSADAAIEDDLSKMADGNDDLARMASGDDDLAEMAAGGQTSLSRQIEADLAGAKVTFDGARPVIDAEQVEITQTPDGAPQLVSTRTGTHPPTPVGERSTMQRHQTASTSSRRSDEKGGYDRPVTKSVTSSAGRATNPPTTASKKGFDHATAINWLPFILIGLFILAFGRALAGVGSVVGFVIAILLIYLLIKWTMASSRKTTTMPRDDSWNRKNRR